MRHLGDIRRETGRPEAALACCDEALAIYRQAPDADPLVFARLTGQAGNPGVEEAQRRLRALEPEAGPPDFIGLK